MSFYYFKPYVPVAERREQARKKIAQLKKKNKAIDPVVVEGRTIATSFWGKAWCKNLEQYSDYENRLPRGRSYVSNGFVIDLQIGAGQVTAQVLGSELYKITVTITPVKARQWQAICRDCAGTVDSLIELLQGQLSKAVMDRVCEPGSGLFPSPKEIKLACSCPDWAEMCKHVAATLYGIGARLDSRPELLFKLRQVNEAELLASGSGDLLLKKRKPASTQVLADDNLAALFGLDMADASTVKVSKTGRGKTRAAAKPAAGAKKASAKKSPVRKKTVTRSSTGTNAKAKTKAPARKLKRKA